MIRAPGLLADLDVPFMPRFSLYCYIGDGGQGDGTGSLSESYDEAVATAAPTGLFDAVSKGYTAAYAKDPGLMTLTALPGMGILGLAAALDNAPPGSLSAPEGSNVSGPSGGSTGADGGGWDEPPPTSEEPPPAPPPAVAAPAGPTVTPSPATSAPGTLISRRRRRSRTILTTPQGVAGLGGDGSAVRGTRRTRSLPLKTLLGG